VVENKKTGKERRKGKEEKDKDEEDKAQRK
jgi:hypothetical protein